MALSQAWYNATVPTLTPADIDRFWSHVEPEPNSGCLLWCGGDLKGYGSFSINDRTHSAHRLAWSMAHGPIPPPAWVLHRCDVTLCVRASHLYLGDASQNARDYMARGSRPESWQRRYPERVRRGEASHKAKLRWRDVESIRAALLSGCSKRSLALAFNVSRMTILRIERGDTWVVE